MATTVCWLLRPERLLRPEQRSVERAKATKKSLKNLRGVLLPKLEAQLKEFMAGPLPKAREARRSAAAAKESMENKHKTLIGQIETQEKKLEALEAEANPEPKAQERLFAQKRLVHDLHVS